MAEYVSKEEFDELELTVAKLEKRLKNYGMALSMVLDLVNDGDLGKCIQKANEKQMNDLKE